MVFFRQVIILISVIISSNGNDKLLAGENVNKKIVKDDHCRQSELSLEQKKPTQILFKDI